MQSAALHALEFDRIREALARETMTPLGHARAMELEPSPDAAEVQYRLNATGEAVALLADGGTLSITAPEGLIALLDTLAIGGQPLEPLELIGLADFVDSVDRACAAIRRISAAVPLLGGVAARAASFADEAAGTRRAIAPSGEVVDTASPALRDIRDALRRNRSRLRATLEGLTRGRDTAKYLQDQIVADRGGRYVLMVRAEHQAAIPGIVHGSSASGASLYLEPLATVQTNNEIVELAEREKAEVFRILLALTDAYRTRMDDLDATLHVAGELDLLQAKARLASRMQAVAPTLATDGRLELRGARHPLLQGQRGRVSTVGKLESEDPSFPRVETRPPNVETFQVVANDILITPPIRALIISGPNTGGKTVALKAAGLLPLMAQAGLHIPVDPGSTLTPFRSIFADIGDDQSIAASLSTFSARIAHIVEMERALELPALVLLDEVGGGTDPVEGGALGAAVIDHFRNRGATVVATTHDDALKSYAATTPGIVAAAMGFVPETYAPTYRLVYGAPGRSLALEIAERLGMPGSVIAAARSRRSNRESHLAEHLARVDKEIAVLEQERLLLAQERRAVAEERQKLVARESHVTEREAVLRKRLDDRVNEKLREARAEIDSVVAQVKSKAEALTQQAAEKRGIGTLVVSTGELGQLRVEGRSALESIATITQPGESSASGAAPPLKAAPAAGDEVFVPAFSANGVVRNVSGKHAEVEIRGKRMKVAWRDLRAASAIAPADKPARGKVTAPSPAGMVSAVRELMVIGKTVEQATDEAEKFLDAALLADSRRLRIVHGHGTGRLREAMTKFFRAHPLVATVAPAPDNEGGNGATIVELKD
jgi:DNA mismatch repair protein MutS2